MIAPFVPRAGQSCFSAAGMRFAQDAWYQTVPAVCRPFFGPLVEYMQSGPVIAMVWEGKGVVATGRKIIGALLCARAVGPDRLFL